MQEFVGLFVFLLLAISFAFVLGVACNVFLLRKKQPEIKQSNQLQKAFPVQKHLSGEPKFIVYAVVFLIFVLETILLLPFAVVYGRLGFFAFVEVCIFSFIMLLGLFYALRKNVLRWK